MDPYLRQRLVDEVIYLHSLWHQGPPVNPSSRTFTRNHSTTPNFTASLPVPSPKYVAAPDSAGISKKRKRDKGKSENGKKKKRTKKKKKRTKKLFQSDPPPDPGPEWPCSNPVENLDTTSGWSARDSLSGRPCKFLSDEDRLRFTSLQLQCEVFGACRKFFYGNVDSENDEFDEDDEESDYGEDFEGNKEYEFFFDIFSKNDKLRNYYETSSECGVFCCLVCGGVGKKNSGKRFKSCLGLLQHSIAIKKTEKRRAHLAFGRVICKVLAWDFDRLPVTVLKGEPLGRSLAVSGKLKDEQERNADIDKRDSGHLYDNVVSKEIEENQQQTLTSMNGHEDQRNPMNNDAGLAEATIANDPEKGSGNSAFCKISLEEDEHKTKKVDAAMKPNEVQGESPANDDRQPDFPDLAGGKIDPAILMDGSDLKFDFELGSDQNERNYEVAGMNRLYDSDGYEF